MSKKSNNTIIISFISKKILIINFPLKRDKCHSLVVTPSSQIHSSTYFIDLHELSIFNFGQLQILNCNYHFVVVVCNRMQNNIYNALLFASRPRFRILFKRGEGEGGKKQNKEEILL